MTAPLLRIDRVTKVYPNLLRALDALSLEIPPGVFGLLGPNGAGKSTLMGILSGELGFESGRVDLGGIDVQTRPGAWRRNIAFMPQLLDFAPHQTGREFLRESALLAGLSPRRLRPRIDQLLERTRLVEAAGRAASGYSRGMKQRLAFAASLLADPRLLLLDEPTSGLDPEERVFFRELLAENARDRVIILSTHIVADVERCCPRIGVLAKGRLLFQGAPGELVRRVDGRVWESVLEPGDVDAWVEGGRLVALRNRDGQPVARLVADQAPVLGAVTVPARLEDAYMHLMAESGERFAAAASEVD